ncbi:MAG: hypothetical protein KAR84_07975 [Elusimicrobiales bacterium]|nr:hypothetical protein [Elusimicrobiales bacterium]MCK5106772.1 hypothetical protein [Elusimicrobiales bacterium]
MPEKIKLKDRIKLDLNQPLWKFIALAIVSIGWVYLMFLASNHFLNTDTCASCPPSFGSQQTENEANEDCGSCGSNSPCE